MAHAPNGLFLLSFVWARSPMSGHTESTSPRNASTRLAQGRSYALACALAMVTRGAARDESGVTRGTRRGLPKQTPPGGQWRRLLRPHQEEGATAPRPILAAPWVRFSKARIVPISKPPDMKRGPIR